MAIETLTQKLDYLKLKIRLRLASKIMDKGVKSKFSSDQVLKVNDKQMFTLEGGRYLTEISERELIDNNGYRYNHDVLPIEELCKVIDSL